MEMDGKNIKKLIDEQTDKLEVPASLHNIQQKSGQRPEQEKSSQAASQNNPSHILLV